MKTMRQTGLVAVLICLTVWLDVLTKQWAEQMLALHRPLPVVGETFQLTLNYNMGTAFGLFAAGGGWLLLLTAAIMLGMGGWLLTMLRERRAGSALLPIGLILGGAAGNLVDRFPDGRVTDFLDVGLGDARWPTFNLADSVIVTGVLALVLLNLLARERPSTANPILVESEEA